MFFASVDLLHTYTQPGYNSHFVTPQTAK